MNWPDSLGPMPEEVRELQSYRESNHVRLWEQPYLAAIDALIKLNATYQTRAEEAEIKMARLIDGERAADAEIERLRDALKAGREEYELAVAEMNRRGEEVARLQPRRTGKSAQDYLAADLATRYEESQEVST